MIVITGAAGFIGSYLSQYLTEKGFSEQILVDDFSRSDKLKNLSNHPDYQKINRKSPWKELEKQVHRITAFIHLGARTDTTERSVAVFDSLNLHYSQVVWAFCTRHQIPLIYASSAATYGNGQQGYSDEMELIPDFRPLNPYGWSKQQFDLWAMQQNEKPPFWAGLKFFNVYGPNEYHKGRMASVVYHAFRQIQQTGEMKLFRSHRPDVADGEQQRDFIHVNDVCRYIETLLTTKLPSRIWNVGSGTANTFLHLSKSVFEAMGRKPVIYFTDTPEDIRAAYQYYTCATLDSWKDAGVQITARSLKEGVMEYVQDFLQIEKYY